MLEALPREPGERFSKADERFLVGLAPSFATAVAAAVARDALRVARSRIALAREDERVRVRAQLHDDVGPSLAAVAVQAQTALRRLRRADLAASADAIESISIIAARASADLRSAVDALGPRALDELGFERAVREIAESISADALSLTIEVSLESPIPSAVEQAAYRVVAESLTNVVRHARAEHASVLIHSPEKPHRRDRGRRGRSHARRAGG